MKKICYLFCMICTLGAFNACSDDDDDLGSLIPVTEIVVPDRVQAGGELIIAGNGFAKDCKVLLKNDQRSVELTLVEQLSTSVSFKVPADLAVGEYTVVLVQGGEWPLRKITVMEQGALPDSPINSLLIPKTPVVVGGEVYIQGIGFAKNCEIDLKVREELVKMEITVSNNGVKFNVPDMLATGKYPVILKQDSGQWTLGEISVEGKKINKITEITIDQDGRTLNEYIYAYDAPGGRISSIENIYEGGPSQRVDFKWEDGKLTVEIYFYDPEHNIYDNHPFSAYEYTLGEDGNVTSSESFMYDYDLEELVSDQTHSWGLNEEGQLETYGNMIYAYNGRHISTCTIDPDVPTVYSFDYTGQQANKSAVDLMGEVLFRYSIEGEESYYARIAGVCGKIPDLLPSSVSSLEDPENPMEMGTVTYETDENGYISKFTYDDATDNYFEVTYAN